MKKKSLLLLMSVITYCSFATPSVSHQEAVFFKDRTRELLIDYYASLNLLTGTQLSFDDKEQIVLELINLYYRNASVLTYNDYQNGGISNMKIKEYLSQLNALYGNEKLSASFAEPIISIRGVYAAGDSFYVKAEVKRSFVCSDASLNNTKTIDYYFSFYSGSRDIKVYSMTSHIDNSANLTLAPVEDKSALPIVSNAASNEANPAYFVTDIMPNSAIMKIDGEPVYFINGTPRLVTSGTKRIEISAPGYQTKIIEAYHVKEGENKLSVMLEAKIGTLTVKNKRRHEYGSQVLIDGKPVGTVPLVRFPMREGLHSVQVTKSGYFSKKKNIKITAGKDDEWKVQLVNVENLKKGAETTAKVGGAILQSLFGK